MILPDQDQDPEAKNDPECDTIVESPEPERPLEVGGREGPEPTRFGDWEKKGRCIDF